MTRMVGTGNAPQGYAEGQMFDVPEHDQGTVDDLERKGWATKVDPRDDVGHSKVGVAAAMVRGDMLSDPTDAEIAKEIGDNAHAIVHTGDPDAGAGDYDAEVAAGKRDFYGEPVEGDAATGHVSLAAPKAKEKKEAAKKPSASKPKADDAKAEDKAADDKK